MFFLQRDVSLWIAGSSLFIQAEFSHATWNSTLLLERYEWLLGENERICPQTQCEIVIPSLTRNKGFPNPEPVGTMSRQMCLVSETECEIALKIIYTPLWVRKSLSQSPMQRWEGTFPGSLGFCPTAKWYWTLLHNFVCWTSQPAPYWLQAEKMLKQMGFRSSAEYEHHPMDLSSHTLLKTARRSKEIGKAGGALPEQ